MPSRSPDRAGKNEPLKDVAFSVKGTGFSVKGTGFSVKGTGFSVKGTGFSPYIPPSQPGRL